MLKAIECWWNHNKNEVGKCLLIMLGALVWYVGRELMHRQRLPFVSPDRPPHLYDKYGQNGPAKEA
jgi:hypothetical protein